MAPLRSVYRLLSLTQHSLGTLRLPTHASIYTTVPRLRKGMRIKQSRISGVGNENMDDFRLELEAQNLLTKRKEGGIERIILIDEAGEEHADITFNQAHRRLRLGKTEMKLVEKRKVGEGASDSDKTTIRVFAVKQIINRELKSFRMSTKIEDPDLEIKCRPMVKPLQEAGQVLVRLKIKRDFQPSSLKERLSETLERLLEQPVVIYDNGPETLHVKVKKKGPS